MNRNKQGIKPGKKKKIKWLKASFTIELSLLMPIILYSIMLILFLSFFMHDKCVIEKAMRVSSLRMAVYKDFQMTAGNSENDYDIAFISGVIEKEFNDCFLEQCNGQLIGKWEIDKKIYVYEDEYEICVEGTMKVPMGILKLIPENNGFKYMAQTKGSFINEIDYMWEHRENA